MAMFWCEELVDQIIAKIQSLIAAKLAGLNGADPDDVQVPTPRTDAYYIAEPDAGMVQEYPACFVLVESVEGRNWQVQQGTFPSIFRVNVIWMFGAGNPRDVRVGLYRLARATVEILLANPTVGTFQVGGGVAPSADFSAMYARGDRPGYVADSRVKLAYTKAENYDIS